MKKLIISLKIAHDRREHIKKQFESNNIDYEFFDAIDANQIQNVSEELGISITNTRLGTNEIACFLSHASIWQLAVDHNYPYVCIFEDDVFLGEDSEYYLNNILEWKPEDAHILKLEVYDKVVTVQERSIPLKVGNRKLAKLVAKHTGCAGYVITLETARILLEIVRSGEQLIPVDHIVFGEFLQNYNANIYQMMPAICIQSQHYDLSTPLVSYLVSERNIRYGVRKTDMTLASKVVRELKRLLGQPYHAIIKINLRLKGTKVLKLYFK